MRRNPALQSTDCPIWATYPNGPSQSGSLSCCLLQRLQSELPRSTSSPKLISQTSCLLLTSRNLSPLLLTPAHPYSPCVSDSRSTLLSFFASIIAVLPVIPLDGALPGIIPSTIIALTPHPSLKACVDRAVIGELPTLSVWASSFGPIGPGALVPCLELSLRRSPHP